MIKSIKKDITVYQTSDDREFLDLYDATNHERSLVREKIIPHLIYSSLYWQIYSKNANPKDISFAHHLIGNPLEDDSRFWFIEEMDGGPLGGFDCWSTQTEFLRYLDGRIQEADNYLEQLKDLKFKITDTK